MLKEPVKEPTPEQEQQRAYWRAAHARSRARARGEDVPLWIRPMTPIDHTCDGSDKRRCECYRSRRKEIRKKRDINDRLRKYGMTVEEYDALRSAQDYRCAVCRRHEDDLPAHYGGSARERAEGEPPLAKLLVDHCHREGHVRGLLCNGCNVGLGAFGEDPARLEAAAAWLRASGADPCGRLDD